MVAYKASGRTRHKSQPSRGEAARAASRALQRVTTRAGTFRGTRPDYSYRRTLTSILDGNIA